MDFFFSRQMSVIVWIIKIKNSCECQQNKMFVYKIFCLFSFLYRHSMTQIFRRTLMQLFTFRIQDLFEKCLEISSFLYGNGKTETRGSSHRKIYSKLNLLPIFDISIFQCVFFFFCQSKKLLDLFVSFSFSVIYTHFQLLLGNGS